MYFLPEVISRLPVTINRLLSTLPILHATMIRDSMDENIYLNLVTSAQATKGHALERLVTQCGGGARVIAAGPAARAAQEQAHPNQ